MVRNRHRSEEASLPPAVLLSLPLSACPKHQEVSLAVRAVCCSWKRVAAAVSHQLATVWCDQQAVVRLQVARKLAERNQIIGRIEKEEPTPAWDAAWWRSVRDQLVRRVILMAVIIWLNPLCAGISTVTDPRLSLIDDVIGSDNPSRGAWTAPRSPYPLQSP